MTAQCGSHFLTIMLLGCKCPIDTDSAVCVFFCKTSFAHYTKKRSVEGHFVCDNAKLMSKLKKR